MDDNEKRLDGYQKEMARLNKRFYRMREQETRTQETQGRAAYLQLKKQNEEEYKQSEEAIRNNLKDQEKQAGPGESIKQKAGQATKKAGQGVEGLSARALKPAVRLPRVSAEPRKSAVKEFKRLAKELSKQPKPPSPWPVKQAE